MEKRKLENQLTEGIFTSKELGFSLGDLKNIRN